jgi:hypothetical protein
MFDEVAFFVLGFYRFFLTSILLTDIINDGGLSDCAGPPYIFFYFRDGTFSRALLLDLKKAG